MTALLLKPVAKVGNVVNLQGGVYRVLSTRDTVSCLPGGRNVVEATLEFLRSGALAVREIEELNRRDNTQDARGGIER